jgi:glycosyltransferase involved in cell wall biosynthesis
MKKLIRITTVPESLQILLQGQLHFMSQYYDVIAISSDGPCFDDMLKEQGVRGVKISMTRKITPLADLKALFALIKLFRKEKPFIVHSHTPKAGILAMLASWITKVPHRIHTVAGMPLLVAHGWKRKVLICVERLTYACATNVYPNSSAMKDLIVKMNLAKSDKLKVIGNGSSNGIDTSYFNPNSIPKTKSEIRKDLSLNDNDFVFVFIGRIVGDKGINELVRAFKKLIDECNNCKLLLVGSMEKDLDPINKRTEAYINESNNIIYFGSQKDVRPYLIAADAFVFPSYREGFPNVIMQAGAMGIPSIVTDINGCNEIVIPDINGVIIPTHDVLALYESMKRFLLNPECVESMGKNCRELITSRYERGSLWESLLKEYRCLERK